MSRVAFFFALMSLVFAGLFVADLRGYFNIAERPVAFLKGANGAVRRLAKSQLTWSRAQGGTLFGSGDTISTGEGARAKLTFYAGGELELDAGAMVVLAGGLEELKLNFLSGTGKIKVAKTAAAKFSVSRGLKTASAKAVAKAPARAASPAPGSTTTTPAPGATTVAQATPTPGATAVAQATPEPGATTVAQATPAGAQPSSDEGTLAPDTTAPAGATTAAAPTAGEPEEAESVSGIEVAVVEDLPVPAPPPAAAAGSTIAPTETQARAPAAAVPASGGAPGTAPGPAGAKVADTAAEAEAEVETLGEAAPALNIGTSVREESIRDATRTMAAQARPGGEILTAAVLPPVPTLVGPGEDAVIDLAVEKAPRLEWNEIEETEGVPKVEGYEVLLRPASGKGEEKLLKTDEESLSLTRVAKGKYLWSVRAITADGRRGPASKPRWIEVRVPAQISRPTILPVRIE
jgi:hypothetical protein